MLDWLKGVLGADENSAPGEAERTQNHDVRIAACALFLEMAHIDGEFSNSERESIFAMFEQEYGLSERQMTELANVAERELKHSIDLWQFTHLINKNFSEEEKIQVIELLWKLIYADGRLDHHEDYLIHKLAQLLHIDHQQLIAAKLKILHNQK
ncbi:MAG: TerB family tellurite resistance protein [bacterium]